MFNRTELIQIFFLMLSFVHGNAQEPPCRRLKDAIIQGNTPLFEKLIEINFDIDCEGENGSSPLGIACSRGEIKMVKALIKRGADPNLIQVYNGRSIGTPLFGAVSIYEQELEPLILEPIVLDPKKRKKVVRKKYDYNIKDKIVKILIENGANVKVTDSDKTTVLMRASASYRQAIFKLLLDGGVDINAQCNKGYTALMLAIFKEDIKSVERLLELGANSQIKDVEGKTAIDYAREKGLKNIVVLLERSR